MAAQATKTSLKIAMLAPRKILNTRGLQEAVGRAHADNVSDLVQMLGRLKGASMKVGQLASFVDVGLLPEGSRDLYQEGLASLRDAAPPMSADLVVKCFERELGDRPENLFESFDIVPCAAASLGQVHLATMKDGAEVAVKVQYPGIVKAIRSDLALTSAVKPLMPLLAPGLDASEALDEIRSRVLEECDYTFEAENLAFLANHYREHPFFWIPAPVRELSTSAILTMERAYGSPFSKMRGLSQARRNRIGEILFRFYYGSLHRLGFTSADPHPGNYFLMDDGRIALFDFGLTCSVPEGVEALGRAGLVALAEGDHEKFFQVAVEMGYIKEGSSIDAKKFFEWAQFSLAPLAQDRQYTFTREFIAQRTSALMDVRNPWWKFVRSLSLPRWALLTYRLELGLFAVLAQLEARANWHRIALEFYSASEPSTPLGLEEKAWRLGDT